MDDKKKIVLGSEDILIKGVSDIFLNVSLQQTFNQIKKSEYDNNFDLAEQFRKERNASRDFRIYGIVDSTIIHTDNLSIKVYKNSGLTQFIGTIKTTPLVYNEENVYAKRRGKYLLELNNYDADLVYFKIEGDDLTYGDQVFEQRLVFYTLDGEFVEYGTETVDIGLNNPGFLNIENNFPFFYNKHWIKKNLNVVEEKPTIMQFGSETSSVKEGQSISIDIVMDKPSPFGNESVTLNAILGTVIPADFNLKISGSTISFPITLNWSPGEQNKTLTFDAITDNVNEFSENVKFDLYNFQFTNSGLTTSHYTTIEDATPRKKTIYNIGEIYRNRVSFTGRTVQGLFSSPITTASAYAILRNGLHFGNTNEEFYPGDTYTISVTNMGVDTILPLNPEFGINTEQLWPAGTSKQFNIDTSYTGNEKHKVKMFFPQGPPPNFGKLRINGADMGVSTLSFANISNRILDSSSNDWLPIFGLEKDWTAVAEGSSAITITSKTTGVPLKIDILPTSSSFGFPSPGPPNPSANPYLIQLSPYVERKQIPKALVLYANNTGNTHTNYEFQFIKQGYLGVLVDAQIHAATVSGVNRYLVTSFKYVCRNWDDVNDTCIYSSAATVDVGGTLTELSNGTPVPTNYLHVVGNAYINGTVFLSSNNLPETKRNLTLIDNAEFKTYPLIVEPCTNEDLMVESISQISKLTIPTIGQSISTIRSLYEFNANGFRSFDFRTGTTGPYTTFYKNNPGFYVSDDMKWSHLVYTSGASTFSGVMSRIMDYGQAIPPIPAGPLLGQDLTGAHLSITDPTTTIYLKLKTPGIPFQINNIVNAYVENSATLGIFGPSIIAGTTIGPITFETITESAIEGVDINTGKNWMGGYNTDLQIGPTAIPGSGGTISLPSLTLPPATFSSGL